MTAFGDDLDARILRIIGALCPDGPRPVTPTDRIVEDLGFHSVKIVELTIALEDEFGLPQISDDHVAGLRTAEDLAALITSHVAEQVKTTSKESP